MRSPTKSLAKSPTRSVTKSPALVPLSPAPPTPPPEPKKETIPFSEWMERRALQLYRERTRAAQVEARRKYVAGVKEQLVRIICKK